MGIDEYNKDLGDQNRKYVEIWSNKDFGDFLLLGDLHLMVIKEIIGNISSTAQHSRDEVVPSRSCLISNKFLAWTT